MRGAQWGARVKSGGGRDDHRKRRKWGNQKENSADQKEHSVAAGNKSVNDGSGGQWSGHRTMEQGKMQQPTNGSGKGEQWLAIMRVRGQQLAMMAKGGSSRRRDCHGQRGYPDFLFFF
jgi:hypothetical protein